MPGEKYFLFEREMLHLILEKGYKGATIRKIAQILECDVANIYNYIPSKSRFLKEQVFNISARFHQGIDEIRDSHLSAVAQIREVVRLYVSISLNYPLQAALLVNEWRHLDETDLQELIRQRTSLENKVRKIVQKGIKSGDLIKINPDTGTYLLLSALRWLFTHTREYPVKNKLQLEEDIWNFISRGLIQQKKK